MLFYTVSGVSAICTAIGWFYFNRMKPKTLRWLVFFLTAGVVSDLIYKLMPDPTGRTTRFIYCFLIPFEYLVYVYLFNGKYRIRKTKSTVVIAWLSVIIVGLFGLYQLIFNLEKKSAATDTFALMSIFTVAQVLWYFWGLLKSDKIITLTQEPLFWVATGTLFYYTGNVISTGFYHRLYAYSKQLASDLYLLNYVLGIIRYVLFGIAFIIASKRTG